MNLLTVNVISEFEVTIYGFSGILTVFTVFFSSKDFIKVIYRLLVQYWIIMESNDENYQYRNTTKPR